MILENRKIGLQKKIAVIYILCFIIMVCIGYAILEWTMMNSIKEIEEISVNENLSRVQSSIKENISYLEIIATDWGGWDDTYFFTQNNNVEYIESNYQDESFINLGVHLIAIADDNGKVLYARQWDSQEEKTKEISPQLYNLIEKTGVLNNKDANKDFSGIIEADEGAMLIGTHPVLTSLNNGPAKGNIIFGKYLNQSLIDNIAESLKLDISIQEADPNIYTLDYVLQMIKNGNPTEIVRLNEEKLRGSMLVTDIFGASKYKVTIEMPRNMYQSAKIGITVMMLTIITIFFAIFLILLYVLDSTILSRILKLHKDVKQISNDKILSNRVRVDGDNDEIFELSKEINNMIYVIEDLNDKVQKNNETLEIQVKDRTKELMMANIQLEAEIEVNRKIQEEILNLAYHDFLTDLPNRMYFMDELNKSIVDAQRGNVEIAIFFIDLDSFKIINDTMGHDQGDVLLKEVGERISGLLEDNDTVCRIGGDEFIVTSHYKRGSRDVESIAQKIVDCFVEPFILKTQEFYVTGSVGVAIFPEDGEDVKSLLKNADIAMYQAKEMGKNRFALCTTKMKEDVKDTMEITNSLYNAIEREEMTIYYQPQVNGLNGNIIGVEALIRWNHPEKGFLSPAKFIPIAEKTRQIIPIGEWVLRSACKQCRDWIDMGISPVRMAVNLSIHQINSPEIVMQIKKSLEEFRLNPALLEIEITESVAMDINDTVNKTLRKIKELGVSISIDDFGTEYSSLSRIKDLPIDRIKIDMCFIRGINKSEKDEAITKAIIHLAKSLNLNIIAEGVETAEQLEFLNRYKCDEIQGYYFYKPMKTEELKKLLVLNNINNKDKEGIDNYDADRKIPELQEDYI